MVNADKAVQLVIGALVVFYLIANTFNDAGSEIEQVNESIKGGTLIKLLPLFLAIAVIVIMVRSTRMGK